jgi:hypothetical protein
MHILHADVTFNALEAQIPLFIRTPAKWVLRSDILTTHFFEQLLREDREKDALTKSEK